MAGEVKINSLSKACSVPPTDHPKIVAVIPCLNTEPFIEDVITKTRKYVDQVIVIDDGSHDNTAKIAKAAGALVISHDRNLGKGAAMKTAVENSDADIIVFIDGDGQHDPNHIPQLIEPILQGKADLVIGSRYLPGSNTTSMPLSRKLANNLASLVISTIISSLLPVSHSMYGIIYRKKLRDRNLIQRKLSPGSHKIALLNLSRKYDNGPTNYRLIYGRFKWISDCTSGFRAITKESWLNLNLISDGYQIETEMIYEAAKNKLRIAETPVSCCWEGKKSGLSVMKDGQRTLMLLMRKLIEDSSNKKLPEIKKTPSENFQTQR